MSSQDFSRREALGLASLAVAGAVVPSAFGQVAQVAPVDRAKRRIKMSVCKWCYGMPMEEFAPAAAKIGLDSIELLDEGDWATVKQHGMTCAIANGPGGIADGWNRIENHDKLVEGAERLLPKIAAAGLPQMIVFSGNRRGQSDADGIINCAKGLKRITPLAEKLGVTVIMELLNSKVDHGDYQCDKTPWGVELVKQVGSDRFKLLYDIYHMQIMEGDVIRTIEKYHEFINHYHTGGNPGRNEIDETQELNYRRIAQAIADTGFKGFIAQEFIPKKDPLTSLAKAVALCSV